MSRQPSPLVVDPLRARAIRGPRTDGRWYWQARMYRDATEKAVWSGWATREEAGRHLAGLVASGDLDRGPARYEEVTSVRDLLECWIATYEDRADIADGTRANYRTKARHLATGLGAVRLDRLDLSALEAYRDRRSRAGAAGASVAMELNILRIAWAWGREVGACPARDLPKAGVKCRPVRNRRTPEIGEVAAVLDHLDGWKRAAVVLLLGTGARIGEVASLRWSAVDLDGAEVALAGKTGERVVPIGVEVVEALRALPRSRPHVLGVTPKSVRVNLPNAIEVACRAAGVAVFTPHGLRRAAVDTFLRAGVDVGTASAFLGHSPAVMLQHYRRATRDDLRRAVATARLGALPAGEVVAFGRRAGG